MRASSSTATVPPLILGLTADELSVRLNGDERARAMIRWLFSDECRDLADSAAPVSGGKSGEGDNALFAPAIIPLPTNIPGVSHRILEKNCGDLLFSLPSIASRHISSDGTIKYALAVGRDEFVESVLIPSEGRSTLCVSSQVGCTRKCAFCATARLGFRRNLRADEIVAQFWLTRRDAPKDAPLRNIVFMGMGEPMDNLDEVLRAIKILTQQPEPQLSARNITVSTSGVLPGIRRLLSQSRVNLALSLNAATQECRRKLMPQSDIWTLDELLDELRADALKNPGRDIFVEMVLFRGINDSADDARCLVKALHGVNARVNLIAHNSFDGSPFTPTSEESLQQFKKIVLDAGIRCLTRIPRGQEISAACGQLALKHKRPSC